MSDTPTPMTAHDLAERYSTKPATVRGWVYRYKINPVGQRSVGQGRPFKLYDPSAVDAVVSRLGLVQTNDENTREGEEVCGG